MNIKTMVKRLVTNSVSENVATYRGLREAAFDVFLIAQDIDNKATLVYNSMTYEEQQMLKPKELVNQW